MDEEMEYIEYRDGVACGWYAADEHARSRLGPAEESATRFRLENWAKRRPDESLEDYVRRGEETTGEELVMRLMPKGTVKYRDRLL